MSEFVCPQCGVSLVVAAKTGARARIEAGKYRLGDSRALECLNKALELDPKDAGIWHNKGICHLNRREFQEALKALDKALKIAPNWKVALKHRRLAYEKCMSS